MFLPWSATTCVGTGIIADDWTLREDKVAVPAAITEPVYRFFEQFHSANAAALRADNAIYTQPHFLTEDERNAAKREVDEAAACYEAGRHRQSPRVEFTRAAVNEAPPLSGIYRIYDTRSGNDELIYLGWAGNLWGVGG